jgi:hypothetical protein
MIGQRERIEAAALALQMVDENQLATFVRQMPSPARNRFSTLIPRNELPRAARWFPHPAADFSSTAGLNMQVVA